MENQLELFPAIQRPLLTAESANCAERQRIEAKFRSLLKEDFSLRDLVSYVGNKDVPILRLYRYKEAFAFTFVEHFFARFALTKEDYIFDPFCGMGTTLFAAMQNGIPSISIDRLPIAAFVSQTLPLFLSLEPNELRTTFGALKEKINKAEPASVAMDVKIMQIAFPADTLLALRRWKSVIDALPHPTRAIFLLLFFSILEPCSYTAKDGQFLRLKRNKRLADPTAMLEKKVNDAELDIQAAHHLWGQEKELPMPQAQLADARDLRNVHLKSTNSSHHLPSLRESLRLYPHLFARALFSLCQKLCRAERTALWHPSLSY